MGLNGFIVMASGGTPLYSNIAATRLSIDPTMFAAFLSAIQSFSQELAAGPEGGIKEMTLHKLKVLYRHIEGYTFIGIVDPDDKIKDIEAIMEYVICGFLARFRKQLHDGLLHDTSVFLGFDDFFEKWRKAKEKELQKWCERVSPTLLQGVLNLLIHYFPAIELVNINTSSLKIIGQKLLWVDVNLAEAAEADIFATLKKKTTTIYGPGIFDKIVAEARRNLETQVLMH